MPIGVDRTEWKARHIGGHTVPGGCPIRFFDNGSDAWGWERQEWSRR